MYHCWICKADKKDDFSIHHNSFICDNCLSVLNYHYNEALKEMQATTDVAENEFIEALVEYADYKGDEYNEQLRKERKKQWQK